MSIDRLTIHLLMLAIYPIIAPWYSSPQAHAQETDADGLSITQYETALQIWKTHKAYFFDYAERGTKSHRACYYDLQHMLTPVLEMAERYDKYALMTDLAEIVTLTYDNLHSFGQIRQWVNGKEAEASPVVLSKALSGAHSGTRTWFNQDRKNGKIYYEEVLLYNFQYLYFVCKLTHYISRIPYEERSAQMNNFLRESYFITEDQLIRNIYDARYANWDVLPAMTGYQALALKLHNKRTEKDGRETEVYYNAVLDREMWLIAAAAEWIAANGSDPSAVYLSSDQRNKLIDYIRLGSNLLESRLSVTKGIDFNGQPIEGFGFDLGRWIDHPEFSYAFNTDQTIPVKSAPALGKKIGWDLSHADRFPWIFTSLHHCREYTGASFPDESVLQKLANQFVYITFNGNLEKPLFSNFMDGTNGWYRVNYEGNSQFGYGPSKLSEAVLNGARAMWSPYNADIVKVMDALWSLLNTEIKERRAHSELFYNTLHNYPRGNTFIIMLKFASACSTINRK